MNERQREKQKEMYFAFFFHSIYSVMDVFRFKMERFDTNALRRLGIITGHSFCEQLIVQGVSVNADTPDTNVARS